MNDEARKKFDEMFSEALRQNRLSHEKFTVKQLAEAVWQALVCGDFVRYVNVEENAQKVVYIPFREHERLKARIKELVEQLRLAKSLCTICGEYLPGHATGGADICTCHES